MEQSFLDQYHAVRQSVGVLDLGSRRTLRLTGTDRIQFFHAMISNEVQSLEALHGRHGTLLRPTGKLVADFYYYRFPECILIDIAPTLAAAFLDTIQRLIVMDDVMLEDVSDSWTRLSVQGPKSEELIRAVLNTPGTVKPLSVVQVVWRGDPGWLIRKDHLADKGFEIWTPRKFGDELRKALLEPRPDLVPFEIAADVADLLRLERGIPVFGVDMDGKNNPIEAGLDDAISFNKGCYVGQEVISKATYVGGVSRFLRSLLVATDLRLEAGAEVLSEEGKTVGHLTSSAFSPALGRTVALAYIKRTFADPGRRLKVASRQESYDAEVAAVKEGSGPGALQ